MFANIIVSQNLNYPNISIVWTPFGPNAFG